jgi:hypothetical protein
MMNMVGSLASENLYSSPEERYDTCEVILMLIVVYKLIPEKHTHKVAKEMLLK